MILIILLLTGAIGSLAGSAALSIMSRRLLPPVARWIVWRWHGRDIVRAYGLTKTDISSPVRIHEIGTRYATASLSSMNIRYLRPKVVVDPPLMALRANYIGEMLDDGRAHAYYAYHGIVLSHPVRRIYEMKTPRGRSPRGLQRIQKLSLTEKTQPTRLSALARAAV